MSDKYHLLSEEWVRNPHPIYAALRQEEPVHAAISGGLSIWFITRYEDVQAVLKDSHRFVKDRRRLLGKEPGQTITSVYDFTENHMLNKDHNDHARLRALVGKAFTPRLVRQLEPRTQAIADALLDKVAAKGHMDLVSEYAYPLPLTVIGELLGVDSADNDRFHRWSEAALNRSLIDFNTRMWEFIDYLSHLFEKRRQEPKDDLVSHLLQVEEAGDRLSEAELFSMVLLLLVAGHETTVNLITNGTLALLQHRDQWQALCENPTLMETAVEELLRYDGPVNTSTFRWAAEDVQLGGKLIKRGEAVLVVITSANRDERQFEEANVLNIQRTGYRHLAFGHGVHYCLGAPLARMEGRIALNTLTRRFPTLQLAIPASQVKWHDVVLLRGPASLPVRWS